MSEIPPSRGARRVMLIWAVSATLAAFVLGNVALLLWVRLRQANAALQARVVVAEETARRTAPRRANPADMAPTSGEFEKLKDSDVAGRYRFFQDGEDLGKITLLPNHSIINKDGTTYPRYHWEITPAGIMTTWQRGDILLNVMEKPGVYVARKNDGSERLRIEKLAE
jgi:hypothetical protein